MRLRGSGASAPGAAPAGCSLGSWRPLPCCPLLKPSVSGRLLKLSVLLKLCCLLKLCLLKLCCLLKLSLWSLSECATSASLPKLSV